jgi:hypothetical protein
MIVEKSSKSNIPAIPGYFHRRIDTPSIEQAILRRFDRCSAFLSLSKNMGGFQNPFFDYSLINPSPHEIHLCVRGCSLVFLRFPVQSGIWQLSLLSGL